MNRTAFTLRARLAGAACFAALTVILGTLLVPPLAGAPARHLRLVRAEPAKDTTLSAAPTSLKLYFSEDVKPAVAGVRLLASDSSAVTLGALSTGDGKPAALVAPITGAMRAGAYRVRWRVTGADGHTLTGEFAFRIRSPASTQP